MVDKKRCSERVFSGARWDMRGHMCGVPATMEHEGARYCKRHYPPFVAAKREEDKRRRLEELDAERKARVEREATARLNERKIAAYDWLNEQIVQVYESLGDSRRMFFGRTGQASESLADYVEQTRRALESAEG